jgi:hypothetical protein
MELANHNRVQLVWVPGHEGIAGNETANQLAKTGSEYPFIGPEPACGISKGVAKKAKGLDDYEPYEILGILYRTQTGKGTHTGILCQKSTGTTEVK